MTCHFPLAALWRTRFRCHHALALKALSASSERLALSIAGPAAATKPLDKPPRARSSRN